MRDAGSNSRHHAPAKVRLQASRYALGAPRCVILQLMRAARNPTWMPPGGRTLVAIPPRVAMREGINVRRLSRVLFGANGLCR